MTFYLSLDLHHLNPKVWPPLPISLYNHCVALGIARRPRYIHRGSHKHCTGLTTSVPSVDGCTIPAVSSSSRRLYAKTRREGGNINYVNHRSLEYVPLRALPPVTTSSATVQPSVKMALVNATSLSNKTLIMNNISHLTPWIFCL